jgi:copper chaperone
MSTSTYTVVGMTCEHCVKAVSGEISRLAGVESVEVDLGTGVVRVTSRSGLLPQDVAAAVAEAGYELESPAPRAHGRAVGHQESS